MIFRAQLSRGFKLLGMYKKLNVVVNMIQSNEELVKVYTDETMKVRYVARALLSGLKPEVCFQVSF